MTTAASESREARALWESRFGTHSLPAQWDSPRYRAAYPDSAAGDDAWTARGGALWPELPALSPLEQLTAGKFRRKPDAVSGPCGVVAAPAVLTRCPRPVRVIRRLTDLVTGQHTLGEAIELPCWTKRCEFCSVELRRRLVGHYVHALKGLSHLRFVTLTCDPKLGVRADESRKYVLYSWSKFRKRVARRCKAAGVPFVFAGALEPQTSGFYHLHVLCSAPLDDDTLREQAFASGCGAVCDVQLLSDAAPDDGDEADELARKVGYCMAYACKDSAGAPNRRAVVNSEGMGYHSNAAKQARAAYVATARGLDPDAVLLEYFDRRAAASQQQVEREALFAQASARARAVWNPLGRAVTVDHEDMPLRRVIEEEWVAIGRPGCRLSGDTLTKEDVKRFRALSRESVTYTYRERRRREMVIVTHVYDRSTGQHSSTRAPWDGRGRASNNQ